MYHSSTRFAKHLLTCLRKLVDECGNLIVEVLEAPEWAAADHSGGHEGAVFDDIPKHFDEFLIVQGVDLGHAETCVRSRHGGGVVRSTSDH